MGGPITYTICASALMKSLTQLYVTTQCTRGDAGCKSLILGSVRESRIVQGFQWGTREGPLCDEH